MIEHPVASHVSPTGFTVSLSRLSVKRMHEFALILEHPTDGSL